MNFSSDGYNSRIPARIRTFIDENVIISPVHFGGNSEVYSTGEPISKPCRAISVYFIRRKDDLFSGLVSGFDA